MIEVIKDELRSVVSCPTCLRQYHVDPLHAGKLGGCAGCHAHFIINLASPAVAGGDVIIFDSPLEPLWGFFGDGVAQLGKNIIDLLRMADRPVTKPNIWLVIESLPMTSAELEAGGYCIALLSAAHDRKDTEEQSQRYTELCAYFLEYIPTRKSSSINMLRAAFRGVLSLEIYALPGANDPVTMLGFASFVAVNAMEYDGWKHGRGFRWLPKCLLARMERTLKEELTKSIEAAAFDAISTQQLSIRKRVCPGVWQD